MTILHIDFETFSSCDLRVAGLDRYSKDPTTGVHCMAFAFDGEPVQITTSFDEAVAEGIAVHLSEGGLVYAHNASFELALWNHVMAPRYGWPVLKPEQVRCTMAMAYAMALPGALEDVAPALGLQQRKDAIGNRIMLKWCKPKKDGSFWKESDYPSEFKELCDYCCQDVVVERAAHARMRELSPEEQKIWVLDQKINNQGILIDISSVNKAMKLVGEEQRRLNNEMLKTTGGVVGKCTEVMLLIKWIASQGVLLEGVAKAALLDSLKGELPPQVRRALELRQEAAKSSLAKFTSMIERAGSDGRVRGIHQYHGASTGRWAGRGVQFQNVPRPRAGIKPTDIEDLFAHLTDRDYVDLCYGPVLDALVDCVRGMVIAPPGKDLISVDFSAVEARVLAWLAGQESVLEVFRTTGKIYEHAAAGIYHVPADKVSKSQRQVGKTAVLALGYGGGKGAFQKMGENYGVKVSAEEADGIKLSWRAANPAIVQYWYDLDGAAIEALTSGGVEKVGPAGRQVSFKMSGSFLWCQLPSGRLICYPYPELRTVVTPWGAERDALTFMTVVASGVFAKEIPDPCNSGKWKRVSTFGGSLSENITQAVARDLLASSLLLFDQHHATITAHVHDEVVLEVPESSGPDTLRKVEALMAVLPKWATGLPLAAEGFRAKRFRK